MPYQTWELDNYRYHEGMVRCGRVTKVKTQKNIMATVTYPDRGFQSQYLLVMQRNTVGMQDYYVPVAGESVWVLMQGTSLNRGIILGSAYTDSNPPPWTSATMRGMMFGDGSYVVYDTAGGGNYQIYTVGKTTITCKSDLTATVTGTATIKAATVTLDAPTVNITGILHCDNYRGYQGTPTATPKMTNSDGSGGGS
jgi:phage baseplate assembly protein V